jgi:hypothetical protein
MGDGADMAREEEDRQERERETGAFPGSSPFYDGGDVVPGKHAFEPKEQPTARPIRPVTTSVVNPEDIYQRLDRGLALVERPATFQQGLDDLYELRDEIYRGLR